MIRPPWMPTFTDVEREALTTIGAMALIGLVLSLSPELRRLVHRVFNP